MVSPRGYGTLEGAQGLMVAEERDGMYGSLGHHLHIVYRRQGSVGVDDEVWYGRHKPERKQEQSIITIG